jgi:hypothetical protein
MSPLFSSMDFDAMQSFSKGLMVDLPFKAYCAAGRQRNSGKPAVGILIECYSGPRIAYGLEIEEKFADKKEWIACIYALATAYLLGFNLRALSCCNTWNYDEV